MGRCTTQQTTWRGLLISQGGVKMKIFDVGLTRRGRIDNLVGDLEFKI